MNKKLTPQECGKIGGLKSRVYWINLKENNVVKYNENPKRCKFCNEIINYEDRRKSFCNQSCNANFHNGVKYGEEENKCKYCGKILSTRKRVRCKDKICSMLYTIDQYGGINNVTDDGSGSRKKIIKNYYIYKRGHKCEECGLEIWREKPIPLVMHHINGDATNSVPDNIQLLCYNCHAQTPNFCGTDGHKSTRKKIYTLV